MTEMLVARNRAVCMPKTRIVVGLLDLEAHISEGWINVALGFVELPEARGIN
jgi:hypothetical protein